MKLIIRYCHSWGNINTFTIEIDESLNPNYLFEKIGEKLHLQQNHFISRYKRDGFLVNKL